VAAAQHQQTEEGAVRVPQGYPSSLRLAIPAPARPLGSEGGDGVGESASAARVCVEAEGGWGAFD